ncbi:MAG: hypothetical protein GY832_36145 [Chloroflexi bacterium]|nr:hypothetical protein [Chloroflexota bacterium]
MSTDYHKTHHLASLPPPPMRLRPAPSPSSPGLPQAVYWIVPLGQGRWNAGWGVGGGGWGCCVFRWASLGESFGLL